MAEHSPQAMAAADRIITRIDRKLWKKLKQINIVVLFEGVDMQKFFAVIIDEEFADGKAIKILDKYIAVHQNILNKTEDSTIETLAEGKLRLLKDLKIAILEGGE